MITSNISGIRLLPLYKCTEFDIRNMYSKSRAWQFRERPAFQMIDGSAHTVELVNFETGAASSVSVSSGSLDYLGITYTVGTVSASSVTPGVYFYRIDGGTYYSPVFEVQDCPENVVLKIAHSCESFLTGLDTFESRIQLNQVEEIVPEEVAGSQEAIELDDGTIKVVSAHVRTVWRLQVNVSRDLYERLLHVTRFDSVVLQVRGTDYNIKEGTFSVEGNQPENANFVATLKFQENTIDEIVDCNNLAFIDEGGEINDTGGVADIDHPDLVVAIDSSSLPDLSADITGTPPLTPRTVQWFRNGVLFSTAETIQIPNEDAVWKLTVKIEGFNKQSATYTYVNECNKFIVDGFVTAGTINANFENVPTGGSVTVEVKDDQGTVVSSSVPYTPTTSGVYTIEATVPTEYGTDCVKSYAALVNILDSNICEHTVGINRNGGTLESDVGNLTGSPTLTYSWEFINELDELMEVATTEDYTPDATGLYQVKVTADGCTVTSDPVLHVQALDVRIVAPVNVITDDRFRYLLANDTLQSFVGLSYIEITNGTLPDISAILANGSLTTEEKNAEVNKLIQVYGNRGLLSHSDPTTFTTEFRVDNTQNRIYFHAPLDQYDVFHVWYRVDIF